MNYKIVGLILGVLILFLVFFLVFPYITMICWNFVMPKIFALPTITFMEAMALNWLAATFFKSTNYNYKQ